MPIKMHNPIENYSYIEHRFSVDTILFSNSFVHFYNHTRYVLSHTGSHRTNRALSNPHCCQTRILDPVQKSTEPDRMLRHIYNNRCQPTSFVTILATLTIEFCNHRSKYRQTSPQLSLLVPDHHHLNLDLLEFYQ